MQNSCSEQHARDTFYMRQMTSSKKLECVLQEFHSERPNSPFCSPTKRVPLIYLHLSNTHKQTLMKYLKKLLLSDQGKTTGYGYNNIRGGHGRGWSESPHGETSFWDTRAI